MQIPAPNLRTNCLHRLIGNSRTEIDEELPLAILRSPRPKCIAQKIELLVRVGPSPVIILAIDGLQSELFVVYFYEGMLDSTGNLSLSQRRFRREYFSTKHR